MKCKASFVLVLAIVAFSGNPAQAGTRDRAAYLANVRASAGMPQEAVRQRPLLPPYQWESLGDHLLLIWQTRRRAWLVGLENRESCRDFPHEYAMRLDSSNDWLSTRNGHIAFRDHRCKIIEIRPVDVRALNVAEHGTR